MLRAAERRAEHPEVGGCLLGRAGQVGCADVGELALEAQSRQRQAGGRPADQHEPQAGGLVPDQLIQPGKRLATGQQVHVVEDEHHGIAARADMSGDPWRNLGRGHARGQAGLGAWHAACLGRGLR